MLSTVVLRGVNVGVGIAQTSCCAARPLWERPAQSGEEEELMVVVALDIRQTTQSRTKTERFALYCM